MPALSRMIAYLIVRVVHIVQSAGKSPPLQQYFCLVIIGPAAATQYPGDYRFNTQGLSLYFRVMALQKTRLMWVE